MSDLLKYELFRLKRNKMFWVFVIASLAYVVFIVGFFAILVKLMPSSVTDPGEYDPTSLSAMGGMMMFMIQPSGYSALSFCCFLIMIPLILVSIATSTNVSQEFGQGTMRNLVMSGKPRHIIYLSKLIISTCVTLIFVAVSLFLAFSVNALIFGVGKIDALLLLRAIGLALILSTAVSCFTTFVSFFLRKTATTIVMIAVLAYILYTFNTLVSTFSMQFPKNETLIVISNVIDSFPFIGLTNSFNYSISLGNALRYLIASLGFIAAATFGGIAHFRAKDLK